ncbi:hypothetical protein AMTRI_Chr13g86560 [Amborella trichopoda]
MYGVFVISIFLYIYYCIRRMLIGCIVHLALCTLWVFGCFHCLLVECTLRTSSKYQMTNLSTIWRFLGCLHCLLVKCALKTSSKYQMTTIWTNMLQVYFDQNATSM